MTYRATDTIVVLLIGLICLTVVAVRLASVAPDTEPVVPASTECVPLENEVTACRTYSDDGNTTEVNAGLRGFAWYARTLTDDEIQDVANLLLIGATVEHERTK